MKKTGILLVLTLFVVSACRVAKNGSYSDDVYVTKGDLQEKLRLEEATRARLAAAEKQRKDSLLAVQKAKENTNPYYKDPNFSNDDYYDYQYASRINRFNRPLTGAGYYDPYYTNYYTYCGDPRYYGVSIYSTYNYWQTGPQVTYGYYSQPITAGYWNPCWSDPNCSAFGNYKYGYMNTGCNTCGYCNTCGFSASNAWGPVYLNNGYYSYGNYGSYGYWGNGYAAPGYGTNWGYFNSQDPNSGYSQYSTGVRGEAVGGAGRERTIQAGSRLSEENNTRGRFIESVATEQNGRSRFDAPAGSRLSSGQGRSEDSRNGTRMQQGQQPQTDGDHGQNVRTESGNSRVRNSGNNNSQSGGGGFNTGTRITQSQSEDWNNRQENNASKSSNTSNGGGGWNSGGNTSGSDGGGTRSRGGDGGSGRPR